MTHVIEHPESIAIIAMAGRFPDAPNVEVFWNNLASGKESVSFFTQDELKQAGYRQQDIEKKSFIGASAVLKDIDAFDGPFFQCTAQESELMDPQHRFFLESCWHTLQQGGYSAGEAQNIGVFAGCGLSTYMMAAAPRFTQEPLSPMLQLLMGNDKDYLASRVSYKLNLTGPSMCVQSACSTSLLSVHTAIQSLLNGECHMALAGGVDISVPQRMGYEYQEGMIFSEDGHCRPFDQEAKGTVAGNGCGVVLLKHLDDAIRDGDKVLAVIRGSSVNNDGSEKIGYTAPSIQGQAKVIADALAAADVCASSIGYVEAHGTGTPLGDPIEVRALNQVFSEEQMLPGVCALGSLKSNIGHLNAAAGIASLIKVIQSLRYGKVCPSLHYQQANTEIEFEKGPFYVSTELHDWPVTAEPRRAGVSSFGFGGTNVHMVLEQSPVEEKHEESEQCKLITLSAHTPQQLKEQAQAYLQYPSDVLLDDMAYTSLYHRPHYAHRSAMAVHTSTELKQELQALVQLSDKIIPESRELALIFTGQGALSEGMAHDLYQSNSAFRQSFDKCDEMLTQWLDIPLSQVLFEPEMASQYLGKASYAQPALFVVEYSLACMWQQSGLDVSAVAGHSVGEYVAACIAGVFDLEQGLGLIATRGRLIHQLEGETGSMIAVFETETQVKQRLGDYPYLSIAAVNGPSLTVVSGDNDAMGRLQQQLDIDSCRWRSLDVSHGFHSVLMESIMDKFEQYLSSLTLCEPQIALYSNLYGRQVKQGEVTKAEYWLNHLRQPVLFMQSIQSMELDGISVFVECGPAEILTRMGPPCIQGRGIWIPSLQRKVSENDAVIKACAALYSVGIDLDWSFLSVNMWGNKTLLPEYPLVKHRYWLDRVEKGLQQSGIEQVLGDVNWQATLDEAERQAKGALYYLDLPGLQRDQDLLVTLAQAYVVKAFTTLGLFSLAKEFYLPEQLMTQGQVISQYGQLLERLLDELVEGELLQKNAQGYHNLALASELNIEQLKHCCEQPFAEHPSFAQVFCLAGERLAEVLSGQRTAIEAMMGESSLDETRSIYADLPTSKYFNSLLRESVKGWLTGVDRNQPLRILEIGSGTGATSEQLLPVLPLQRTYYCFTDVSPLFLDSARNRFTDYPFVDYQLYDINRSVTDQAFELHSFDLVVASNVLHAADDLTYTMTQVYRLLKPGAMLLMYEIVNETLIGELTTGLLLPEVKDTKLRGNQPFMTEPQWLKLLTEQGFDQFESLPKLEDNQTALGERVIYARRNLRDIDGGLTSEPACMYKLNWIKAEDHSSFNSDPKNITTRYLLVSAAGDWDKDLLNASSLDDDLLEYFDIRMSSQDLSGVLEKSLSSQHPTKLQIIYVTGADYCLNQETLLKQQQSDCYEQLLKLLDNLAHQDKQQLAGLSIVTCGAQNPQQYLAPEDVCLMQGAFWGFSQVVALGHPELKVNLIDLDPQQTLEVQAEILPKLIQQSTQDEEYQRVSRNEHVYYARIENYVPSVSNELSTQLDKQGWYLLAGGLGGLGMETADWLVEKGAKNLLLLGRSAAKSEQNKQIEQWRNQGITVRVEQLDITDKQRLFSLLGELDMPLKGIFHCAVVCDTEQLGDLSPLERAMAVMDPKVTGAWNLHELSLLYPLDLFVMYSSSVSMVPARGLPEYVAANSFLDRLCEYRRQLDLPSLSVSWGAWSEVGTVADSEQIQRLEQSGLNALSPQKNLNLLEQVLSADGDKGHCGILNVKWSLLLSNYPQSQLNTYYHDVLAEGELRQASLETHGHEQAGSDVLHLLKFEGDESIRLKLISEYIRIRVGQILRLTADEVPMEVDLMQLGVDSLMLLDLLNGLNQGLKIQVKPNEVMANLTVTAMAEVMAVYSKGELSEQEQSVALITCEEDAFEPFVLTDVQQAYWIGRDQNMDLGNVACHGYLEIDCELLNVDALQNAWHQMISRHAMLRCIILPQGMQQVLVDVPKYEFFVENLRSLSASERERQLMTIRKQLSHKVPDTAQWPLFEIRVSHLNESTSRLHISLDNIMTDGRSIGIMLNEWVRVYHQPSIQLPALGLSFRDYVMSLDTYRQSQDYMVARSYWRERLDEVYPSPQLLLVKDVSQIKSPQFKRRAFHLSSQQWLNLKKRGAEQAGLTPSGLLLSVYAYTLANWSQSRQFTLNVPTFSRLPFHSQVNDIIGEFTSLILVSVDLSEELPFAQLAGVIQKQLLKDQAHDSFSGIQVMRELVRHTGEPQRANMPVVFTSTFGLTEQTDTGFSENEQEASVLGEQVYTISQTPQVYIDNHVHDHGGKLNVYWDTVDELFPAGALDNMFEQYSRLLLELSSSEENWQEFWHQIPAQSLPQEQLMRRQEYNETSLALPGLDNLLAEFVNQVNRTPDAIAIQTCNVEISYQKLSWMVNSLASDLKSMDLVSGEPVVVMLPKGWHQVIAVMSVLACGGVYVPVDPDLPLSRRLDLASGVNAKYILSAGEIESELSAICNVIMLDELSLEQTQDIYFDYHYSQPHELAYVIYTSGSTGTPKGVKITHGAVCNTLKDINRRFNIGSDDGVFALSALNFDLSVYDIFGTLSTGARMIIPSSEGTKDPGHWLELMAQYRVTVWNSVPQLCQMLLIQADERDKNALSSLRIVMLSGDWIPLSLPEQLHDVVPNCDLISLGGATEASIWSIYYPIGRCDSDWKSIPYGYPLSNQSIHILNEQFTDCPEWVEGDIYIGGIGLAQGYWGDLKRTADAFIIHPVTNESLYKTGDRGRFLPQGYIEFLGRRDHQVKVNGYRIELGEIEAALNGIYGVAQAVVNTYGVRRAGDKIKKNTRQDKQQLLAYCVLENNGPKLNNVQITNILRESLPDYMLPDQVLILSALPLSSNGKVERNKLPLPVEPDKPFNQVITQLPETRLELQILQACQQILENEIISLNSHFFEAGGDSLSATRISVLLKAQGIELSVRDIFAAPILSDLAARCSNLKNINEPVILNEPCTGQKKLFCIHGSDGDILVFRQLALSLEQKMTLVGLAECEQTRGFSVEQIAASYIKKIKVLQPEGPYYLCGYSSGGILAWEMAHQLIQLGAEVANLALIDSGQLPKIVLDNPLVILSLYALSIGIESQHLSLDQTQLKDLLEAEYRQVNFDSVPIFKKEQMEEEIERLMSLAETNIALSSTEFINGYQQFKNSVETTVLYDLLPLNSLPVLLLQTIPLKEKFRLRDFWKPLAKMLLVKDVSGDHFSCLQQPNVESLSRCLFDNTGVQNCVDKVTASNRGENINELL